MKYYIISGEISGDIHGANLMEELLQQDPNAQFRFFGGDRMLKIAPNGLAMHISNLSFMGFVEVIFNLKTILKNIAFCKADILLFKPDVVIFIDFPGFNLRIAEFTYAQKIKSFYYISPQIWAWKENRIKKIKRYINEMYVILPFEVDFYKKHQVEAHFFGNPVLDEVLKSKSHLPDAPSTEKIIAILPGSRRQEIMRMLPIMAQACLHFKNYQFIIPAVPMIDLEFYLKFLPKGFQVKIQYNSMHEVLGKAHLAVVTSGTATLQTALYDVPQVVCYKAHKISYYIAKSLVHLKYISLVNLILNKEIVRELIQGDLTVLKLIEEMQKLEDPKTRTEICTGYEQVRLLLGNGTASKQIAAHMYSKI